MYSRTRIEKMINELKEVKTVTDNLTKDFTTENIAEIAKTEAEKIKTGLNTEFASLSVTVEKIKTALKKIGINI